MTRRAELGPPRELPTPVDSNSTSSLCRSCAFFNHPKNMDDDTP